MIVYTNEENRIVAYGETTTIPYINRIEIGNFFDNKYDAYIKGYCCEPSYRISDTVDGQPVYELDEDGNKIIDGYSLYPFDDSKELQSIQRQYEEFLIMSADFIGGAYE